MLDGLEITQFTYFQQCGGIDLDLVPAELTYGLERLVAFLQGRRQRLRHRVGAGLEVPDVRFADELQYSVYNFEWPTSPTLWKLFELHEAEAPAPARRLCRSTCREVALSAAPGIRPGAEVFEPLQPARCAGAISVTERVGVIARVRKLAVGVAQAWVGAAAIRQRRAEVAA